MGKLSFYHDQPLFGLDIGHSTIKVMQLDRLEGTKPKVLGYGSGPYKPESISSGVITNYESLAKSLHELFAEHLRGTISTRKVVCTVPTARTFSRPMKLPPMNDKDIAQAVHLEAEQYIPVPVDNLYIDFDIARRDDKGVELLMVASPKNIIDSHVKFLEGVGLEPLAIEPTMNANGRFFSLTDLSHSQPTVIIDIGSTSVDLAVFDPTMFVNSTINGGSDTVTNLIAQKLDIDSDQAFVTKIKYGIGVSDQQAAIQEAVGPLMDNLIREVKKIVRYFDDRIGEGKRKVAQIITLGGGATMPGLNQFLTSELKLPTKVLDPWSQIDLGNLSQPVTSERAMYVTALGASLLDSRSILQ